MNGGHGLSVPMAVVKVRGVGMRMNERLVGVRMAVARLHGQAGMGMIVMAVVVPMAMCMGGLGVGMHVRVPRREQEANAGEHHERRDKLERLHRLAQHRPGEGRPEKGRGREQHLRPRCPHLLGSADVEHEGKAVAEGTERQRREHESPVVSRWCEGVMSGVWWKSERKASSSGAVEPQLRPLAAGAGG